MPYSIPATSKTPALIIYLLDISRSMNQAVGGQRRMDTVLKALQKVIVRMVMRSTKGTLIAPRYRIAVFGYHKEVVDLLDGIKMIDNVAEMGIPQPELAYGTQTAVAFAAVEQLLQTEIPNIQHCPAPLVCHMTDGLYGGADPEPIVRRIKKMAVPDGHVLVENIFVAKSVLQESIADAQQWGGITDISELEKPYAKKLYTMSSVIPDSYLNVMREFGYQLNQGARMMFPGHNPDLVELGFTMSGATPLSG